MQKGKKRGKNTIKNFKKPELMISFHQALDQRRKKKIEKGKGWGKGNGGKGEKKCSWESHHCFLTGKEGRK